MKTDELVELLKIPDEIANKSQIWELKKKIKQLNKIIDDLNMKIYRLKKDCDNRGIALHRRKLQIEDLHKELFVVNQFIDPKYK